jgi:signal transduction histidine kinase
MDITEKCPLARTLAERLRGARSELTARWLERISERVALDPIRVFPTDDLLNHVPLLLLGIADYVENPAQVIAAEAPVIAKAMELGALRHAQGFDEYQILKEYEILGGILYSYLARIADEIDEPCTRGEIFVCAHRIFHAIALIQQATTTQFLRLAKTQVREREDRLRAFNRALTHEFRNRIGAAMGAGQLLELPDLAEAERLRLTGVVIRNVDSMRLVLENLLELSRIDADARQQRHVRLPQAAAEVARQLRDFARAAGVELRMSDELPDVEVSAAAVELCLTNLVSNAIKYADSAKTRRWVRVTGRMTLDDAGRPREAVVEVADNGVGVPEAERLRLFERFYRAPGTTVTGVEGTGLGLSIVRETIEALGGRVWAEFPTEGSVFAFTVPCRRSIDRDPSVEQENASQPA